MPGGADAGCLVHPEADVAILPHLRLARVQAHAHLHLGPSRPAPGGEVALGVDAAATASFARRNATKKESPWVSTSRP